MEKCRELKHAIEHDVQGVPSIACVQRSNTKECIDAVKGQAADMITLDGGDVYTAGLSPHPLKPVAAEDYGNASFSDTCYYAVAVARTDKNIDFLTLKGAKSCHTGVGKSAGWNMPIGALIESKQIKWDGPEEEPLDNAVARFFSASCAPGSTNSTLCSLCKGTGKNKCARSQIEPYYSYAGAFQCLKDGVGDVAFVKHTTVPEAEQEHYKLLCADGRTMAIKDYPQCHIARIPAHAVVTRDDKTLMDRVWTFIDKAQSKFGRTSKEKFKLFESPHGKDLIYKDSAFRLVRTPDHIDSYSFLGPKYVSAIHALKLGSKSTTTEKKVKWCTISRKEADKCDKWSTLEKSLSCLKADSTDDCIAQIMKGESDVMTLDGGYLYTAGLCGLVPVMAEFYDKDDQQKCQSSQPVKDTPSYYTVAAIKAGTSLRWSGLKGAKSCHTAIGRTAGWNVPMGLIYQKTKSCDFEHYFSESCAPGANISSPLCALCKGQSIGQKSKCKSSPEEPYYGYSGALRCLVEKGDVGFFKHTTIFENTGEIRPDWAKDLKSENFRLLCLDDTTAPVDQYRRCHLAKVPAHAVVTRPESRDMIASFLKSQQKKYGSTGTDQTKFSMFKSSPNKDLLFKDSTLCLLEIPATTSYTEFLGKEYMDSVDGLKACKSLSYLQNICRFHSCP